MTYVWHIKKTLAMDDKCAFVSIGLGLCATLNGCSAKVCFVIEKVSACFNWLNDVEGLPYNTVGHATLVCVYECCNCHTSQHQQRVEYLKIRGANSNNKSPRVPLRWDPTRRRLKTAASPAKLRSNHKQLYWHQSRRAVRMRPHTKFASNVNAWAAGRCTAVWNMQLFTATQLTYATKHATTGCLVKW